MAKREEMLIPGLTFRWRRSFVVAKASQKIVGADGIPAARQGRRATLGRLCQIR